MNIIWGQDDIQSVIDWEFAGFKAEIYDVANLIGCIGVEDPQALQSRLVIDFIRLMKHKGELSALSWDYLLEFIIAIRFAWMSEWLRKDDREMISLEAVYINYHYYNSKDIKSVSPPCFPPRRLDHDFNGCSVLIPYTIAVSRFHPENIPA